MGLCGKVNLHIAGAGRQRSTHQQSGAPLQLASSSAATRPSASARAATPESSIGHQPVDIIVTQKFAQIGRQSSCPSGDAGRPETPARACDGPVDIGV